jgi:hypothetical protein
MKKLPNKWFVFSTLAFQIAFVMFFSIKAGSYFDAKFNLEEKFYTLVSSVFGVVLILVLISRQSKRIK